MPKNNQDSGIVIINGTAYNAKTGQPASSEREDPQRNKSMQAQRMTDISHLNQPKPQDVEKETPKPPQKDHSTEESKATKKERPTATRAQQLHTIKKGSKEQVLDLRKTARAQKLKEDRRNNVQKDEADKEAEKARTLNSPGVGPKLSQLDTRARLSRARKYQKSESIQKFFPENQPSVRNKSEKVDVAQQSTEAQSTPASQPRVDNGDVVKTDGIQGPSQASATLKSQENLKELAKTRELEKMVQKHPRHVSQERAISNDDTGVQNQQVQFEGEQGNKQTFWSRFKIKPRITSYATAAVAALVLVGFVAYLNMPQMALQVAANRAGFEASMPAYRPSGFSFNGPISYAPGQIVISFGSHGDDRSFEIVQRKTTWDSTSLLENYVAQESEDYVPVQQNGLTIYLFDDNAAAWVDGGVWYTIQGDSQLNSDQLLKVATSL